MLLPVLLSDAGAVDCGFENLVWCLFLGITLAPVFVLGNGEQSDQGDQTDGKLQ